MSIYYIIDEKSTQNDFDYLKTDPSLNGNKSAPLHTEFQLNRSQFDQFFFSKYGLEYISEYFCNNKKELRIITYPYETITCYEKAKIIGDWNPLNIIKALYLENSADHSLCAVVVPETGCFIDKNLVREKLEFREGNYLLTAKDLPFNMSYGTCSPFITESDLIINGGRVRNIIFDTETLIMKKHENTLDDFSFGLDHRLSVQMNYYQCYKMLKQRYGKVVIDEELLTLSFKEKFIRKNGKINIGYEFNTINYRTANFINSIHGYGDVSIINDHIDELDLPEVLTSSNAKASENG